MTNTERLIEEFKHCKAHGVTLRFATGRNTGNGPSVVEALRRRGYTVNRLRSSYYEVPRGPA
ncbi:MULTISPECIES: hypothetical protein [Pseudomonas]|jgi:hypothetical protein|uniref:Uncharacterized protein n=5 Tax=Pseudomonas TaxID=286 RepID=A0A3G1DGE0_PSEAI|nr:MULTISPECIES: hypothetical protein [Pseudomonas]MCO6692638.1 hypothetical protein [Pseudomonas shirazica]PYG98465.1 hypothetical protein CVV67_20735 [Arthrobacter stackebrandtii]AGN82351.1 hypothetical protein L483_15515 [Pseudomonas putida H8234]AMP35712.1 Hypothetical protein [Pseudomonas aeruginosa]ELS0927114.1 hypothetical protein [Pseudomonas putida]